MGTTFNYNIPLNQAIQKIKIARGPFAVSKAQFYERIQIIRKESAIDFPNQDGKAYISTVSAAKCITISCLQFIVCSLFEHYDKRFEEIPVSGLSFGSKIHFAIKDLSNGIILFFKDPEESLFWKVSGKEPPDIEDFLCRHSAHSCKYIYLMYDYAYLQIIGHDINSEDPGRGYNAYSLKWFFKEYFGEDEYRTFHRCFANYISYVKRYLGYSVVKTLTPIAEVNFKRTVKYTLLSTPYERILNIKYEDEIKNDRVVRTLATEDFFTIQNQYLREALYLTVLGNAECAESFVTSEWLYDSMKEAQAIDLSPIVIGYFKSAEQFLSMVVLLLHPNPSEWSQGHDSTLGSIAHFFKDNLHLFRPEISFASRKFIRETLFSYSNLRNGFTHKHNIHNWEKVDEIRDATFNLYFLVLGALKLSIDTKTALGMTSANIFDDYYRLCEYIDYHAGDLFFLCYGDGKEQLVVACPDINQAIVNHNFFQYSGAYYHLFGNPEKRGAVSEEFLPQEIYLGEIVFQETNSIQMAPVKKTKIFTGGKFVGPSIIDEKGENY